MEPIFFLTHEYAPFRGGVATYVEECAHAARRLGYDVRVITVTGRIGSRHPAPTPAGRSAAGSAEDDLPVRRVPSSGRLSPVGIAGLARGIYSLRRELADAPLVALSAGAHMALVSLAGSRLFAPRRVLSFFHGSEILKLDRRWPWRWLAPKFYRERPHFAVASDYVRTLLQESRLWPGDAACGTVHLAPCACSPELLAAAVQADELETEGRQRPITPPGPAADATANDDAPAAFRILTVARIHPRKGQLELANALARLPEAWRRRVVLQLVGTGDAAYLREILAVCQAAEIAVEHLARVAAAELPALYRNCDLFALTSRTLPDSVEGFGIVYLEASAFGRPILAFRTGGVPEAVRDGETGLLVPEGDLEALSAGLIRLMENRALRERLGAAGRIFAQSFRWETAARVLCDAALALPKGDSRKDFAPSMTSPPAAFGRPSAS